MYLTYLTDINLIRPKKRLQELLHRTLQSLKNSQYFFSPACNTCRGTFKWYQIISDHKTVPPPPEKTLKTYQPELLRHKMQPPPTKKKCSCSRWCYPHRALIIKSVLDDINRQQKRKENTVKEKSCQESLKKTAYIQYLPWTAGSVLKATCSLTECWLKGLFSHRVIYESILLLLLYCRIWNPQFLESPGVGDRRLLAGTFDWFYSTCS